MLRSEMAVVIGAVFVLACASGEETDGSETPVTEDTAATAAEGAESDQAASADDRSLVPIEVRYTARLLIPAERARAAQLSPGGDFSASGKGTCQVDDRAGTWMVSLDQVDQGNLQHFNTRRSKLEGSTYTDLRSEGTGTGELFMLTNDGSKTFNDKAVMSATRAGGGATVQFDAETAGRGYALTGTVTCARLSPGGG